MYQTPPRSRANRFAKGPKRERFFQFRQFAKSDTLSHLREHAEPVSTMDRDEELFLIPGRGEHVVRIIDGETFAMRTLVDRDEGIEEWETDANESFPIKRGLSAMIGARVPRIRTALMTFTEPGDLSEAMARKTKRLAAKAHIEELRAGNVKVLLTRHEVEDGREIHSVVLRSESSEAISDLISELPLERESCETLTAHLLKKKKKRR